MTYHKTLCWRVLNILQSKVVFLYQFQILKHFIQQYLAFWVFLQRLQHENKTYNLTDAQVKTPEPCEACKNSKDISPKFTDW